MKKTIPFDLFGEKQEMCFTIATIAELEKAMGKPIQKIIRDGDAGFSFCLAALPLCLKRLNPHIYITKIEEYLEAEEGRMIDDIAMPIIHALAASGALGKAIQKEILAIYYPELYKAPDGEQEKNV